MVHSCLLFLAPPHPSVVLSQRGRCDGDGRRGSEGELQSDRVHQRTVEVEQEWGEHLNCTQCEGVL